jgi:2-(1,2-epoxy-1,2-dihydrophenyl)acetyl-CoA isomerase
MSYENIKYEIKNQTAIITINRPQVFNALNKEAKFEIINAINESNQNLNVRSIILSAEGKAFSSGQDLNDRNISPDHGPIDLGNTLETEWIPLINSIINSEKLVIAAINGVCAGAGLSVALACDLKVTAPGVRFITGFTQIALTPDAGLSYMLVRQMGYARALEFCITGKPLSSEQMLELGLVNYVTDQYLEKAQELALLVNTLAPISVKSVKKNLQFALDREIKDVLENEKQTQRMLGFTQDYKEGVKAFLEKRKPNFTGQ